MRLRRFWLALVVLAAGLGVAAAGLVLALPYLVDLPRVQAVLRAEASRLLDRPVRFDRVSLGYWPLPAVRVRGLTVANAPGFGTDPLLTVEEARVRVRLLSLLRGRLQFGEVTLERPRVVLEQHRDGAWNLPGPGGTRPAPATPFVLVSRIGLRDGRVELRVAGESGADSSAHLVDRIDLALEDLGWREPIRFRLGARLPGGGLALTAEGQVGPLAVAGSDLAALPARLTARFTAEESGPAAGADFALSGRGEGEIRAEGTLGNLAGGGRLGFTRLALAARSAACGGRPARPLVLEAVELPVRLAEGRVTIEPFALRVAGGTVRGTAVLAWRGGVPSVRLADVRIQGVAAEPILVEFLCQPYAVTGRMDASGEGSFAGTGPDLLRSLRSTWQVQVGPGRLVGPAIRPLLTGALRVGSALASVVTRDAPGALLASPLEFDSFVAAGGAGGGQLRVRHFVMQSRALRVGGSGTYGLLDTRLDFDLQVQTGRSSLGVKLAGTSREPSYQPEARGIVKSLADALGAALRSARKSRQPGGARPESR